MTKTPTELPEDELEEYADELDDIELKTVLIDIASTNQAILQQLLQLNATLSNESMQDIDTYVCDLCNRSVPEEERTEHLKQEHNGDSSMGVESFFTPE